MTRGAVAGCFALMFAACGSDGVDRSDLITTCEGTGRAGESWSYAAGTDEAALGGAECLCRADHELQSLVRYDECLEEADSAFAGQECWVVTVRCL